MPMLHGHKSVTSTRRQD